MRQTIFTILTDESARDQSAIETSLDKEFSVGAPWFDRTTELVELGQS